MEILEGCVSGHFEARLRLYICLSGSFITPLHTLHLMFPRVLLNSMCGVPACDTDAPRTQTNIGDQPELAPLWASLAATALMALSYLYLRFNYRRQVEQVL